MGPPCHGVSLKSFPVYGILFPGGKMKKRAYWILFLILFTGLCFAEKVASFTEFINPYEFKVDVDRFYISEDTSIYIYSLKDYQLIKKFGKKGEGPGEFLLVGGKELLIDILPGNIMVNSYGKVVYFTKDGDYLREKKIKAVSKRLTPVNDQFVGLKYKRENKILFHQINLYNSSFELVKTIYQHKHGLQLGTKRKFNPLTIDPPACKVGDNKIFMLDGQHEAVHVFNEKGEPLFSVTNKDELLEFTDEDKKDMLNDPYWKGLTQRISPIIDFPGYFPPINWFYIDPVQKVIYLNTFKRENEKRKYILFDFNGRFIKKILLPSGGHIAFFNGKYYRLVENEDEEVWELHVTEIER
jgi:hypothetical protein